MKGKSNLLKKMMAMLLTAVLIMGMVVGAVPEEVHAETTHTEGNYEYTINGDGKVTITKYRGPGGVVKIPETLGGETVTKIGSEAFYADYELTAVTIPSSVTSIGEWAFRLCNALETVTISEGVTSIGVQAFSYCSALMDVTIPASMASIESQAFYRCTNLKEVKYCCCKKKWEEDSFTIASNAFDYGITVKYEGVTKKEKAATCTEDGYEPCYECSGCGGTYFDENGERPTEKTIIPATGHTSGEAVRENVVEATCTQGGSYDEVVRCSVCKEILSSETKQIPATGHNWSDEWTNDRENHWHECSCGAKSEEAAHNYGGWTVTKQPTESEEGSKERSCSVCGYKQTETIPKTGSAGDGNNTSKIETEEEQGENTPDADFKMSNDDLISAVLTPEEKSLVEAGADVKIILDIDNIDASVDEADKQAVTDKADGYNVGEYLDINLYKIIGEDRTKVSQTNGKVKIALDVPDTLKNTDSTKTRSFAVVRVHDGVAELLTDLDNDATTITFETDLFSTYALVYKDTVNTDKKDDEPKTGDTTPTELYATLAMIAGLSYLLLFLRNRKKGMKEQ